MLTNETDHPCEDLAQEIMERAGAGGVVVIILRRNHPTECIVLLPDVPAAVRAAGTCMRNLAEQVESRASAMESVEGSVSAPGGEA